MLKVPDEKFRDKVKKTIEDNLSTIGRELGADKASGWSDQALNRLMASNFAKVLGPLDEGQVDDRLRAEADRLGKVMLTDEWLLRKGRRFEGRSVRVRSGVDVVQRVYKAHGGLIRVDLEIHEGLIAEASISGDFFCFPATAVEEMETRLKGVEADKAFERIMAMYDEGNIDTPGVMEEDWRAVLAI